MNRKKLMGLGVLFTISLIAFLSGLGCLPDEIITSHTFTSANRHGGGWLLDAVGGAGSAPTLEDETGSEPTPRTVVEPDVIRRDGNWLYILNQFRGLTIVDLDAYEIVTTLPIYGFPRDIYLQGTLAFVLVANATRYEVKNNKVSFDIGSRLYVVDITQPQNASIVTTFNLNGDLVDSRLVGNVLYVVGAEYTWTFPWEDSGVAGGTEPSVIKTQTGSTWVTSVNLANLNNIYIADEKSFSETGTQIHVTPEAIFVAAPNWSNHNSIITYVDISDPSGALQIADSIEVIGEIPDRFKMDFWNGVLRVVSTSWINSRKTYVTTIDCSDPANLVKLAEIEFERAHGEALFATRFDGPRGYVVTYFMVDPLFVLDLSDPAAPQVVGELEVTGWSTHIEPQGDQLIALGVEDANSTRQVCVSLFDVSDPTQPILADRVTFGSGWNWSDAYNDVKAFAVFDDVIVVPFSGWDYESVGGFNRLQFVSYGPGSLELGGFVDVSGTVLRTIYYNNRYHCVTTEQLIAIDASNLNTPQITNQLFLAEWYADVHEAAPNVRAEVIKHNETNDTIVRLVSTSKAVLGELQLQIGEVIDSAMYGTQLVLVAEKWDPDYRYIVVFINCTGQNAPQVTKQLTIDVDPAYYWWGYYDGPVVFAANSNNVVSSQNGRPMVEPLPGILPPMMWQQKTFWTNGALSLLCSAPNYTNRIGPDATPTIGIAVVDLAQQKWTRSIGLGFNNLVSVDVQNQHLFITSSVPVFSVNSPRCAYYVTRINPLNGTASPSVNVPGIFVQYDSNANILTLRDEQWSSNFQIKTYLKTVSWDGQESTVTPIDTLALPDNVYAVLGRGTRIYMQYYTDSGLTLRIATQNANGDLSLGNPTLVTEQWGALIDAHASAAYVSVGYNAIVRYDCTGTSPQTSPNALVEVMGLPWTIRFGANKAYAPLGYFGIAELPL